MLQPRTDTVDLPARITVDGLISKIRSVLGKPAVASGLQELRVAWSKIQVTWMGEEEDSLDLENHAQKVEDLLARVFLNELPYLEGGHETAASALGRATIGVEATGLVVTHCLVGERSRLFEWIGLDLKVIRGRLPERLMGGLIVPMPNEFLSENTLILLGGYPNADLQDAEIGVKIDMEVVDG